MEDETEEENQARLVDECDDDDIEPDGYEGEQQHLVTATGDESHDRGADSDEEFWHMHDEDGEESWW